MEHYRCVTCYVPKTRSIRISDTVQSLPSTIPLPTTSTEDHLCQAVSDIVSILSKPPKTNFPTLELGDDTKIAISKIAKLLN